MKFCTNCGSQIDDDARFCPNCGEAVSDESPKTPASENKPAEEKKRPVSEEKTAEAAVNRKTEAEKTETAQPKAEKSAPSENAFGKFLKKLDDTDDTTSQFEEDDIRQNKAMGILAYIGILILIPFFGARKSKFAIYHVKRAFEVFVLNLAWDGFLSMCIIPWLDSAAWEGVSMFAVRTWVFVITIILSVIGKLFFLALTVAGIYHVAKGKAKELPILGKMNLFR